MLQTIDNRAALFALMQQGACVITPNNRLTNELIQGFFHQKSLKVQAKPACIPYTIFLQQQYKKHGHLAPSKQPVLLTPLQIDYLWRQILANHIDAVNDGLVEAVIEAWRRCLLWQIDINHADFFLTPQTKQFRQWFLSFQHALQRLSAITEYQLADYLILQKANFSAPLVWACFDDFTPQQQALQHYSLHQGWEVYAYDLGKNQTNCFCFAAKDEAEELEQLSSWLKNRLTLGDQHIGVIVPDLEKKATSLKRFLHQQGLAEEINISLGEPLEQYPLVSHALTWLSLDSDQLSNSEARLLLHSPYLAYSQTEMLARAQFLEENAILQQLYCSRLEFSRLLAQCAPKLAMLLDELSPYPEQAFISEWIDIFNQRLGNFGFPGEYSLNSSTFQCYQRLLTLICDDFKQLGFIKQRLQKEEAIAMLSHLAKKIIFQSKKSNATIQILGLLESAGTCFDSLWVTSMTDQCLPQKTKLSAFIPISLQKHYKMPHATIEQQFHHAQQAISRLGKSSGICLFSYPRITQDKPNLPSPLIANIPLFQPILGEKKSTVQSLQQVIEHYQVPLAAEEIVSGGTMMLANQAKCPFRAFAAHRLHAKRLNDMGSMAKERGQVMHRVLECLWQSLENQQTLLSLPDDALEKRLDEVIAITLAPFFAQRPYFFPPLIQEIEITRLKQLIKVYLDWERQRPDFCIDGLEQDFIIQLAGIDFRVRVDRMDQTNDGKKWVIDYKSTLPTRLPWHEDRPQEPQLLLYALLDEKINGLLFIQLKTGQIQIKGLTETAQSIPGLSAIKKDENWQDYRQSWFDQLTALASEFSQGHCLPNPSHVSICQRCDYQTLCRNAIKD